MTSRRFVTATVLGAAVFVWSPAAAQTDWQSLLARDWVSIEGGKMVIEEYSLDKLALPGYEPIELQVKTYSEAPATGFMSRDTFVALTTMVSTSLMQEVLAGGRELTAAQFFESFDSQNLTAPIGRPDLEVNLFMTPEGFQVEVVDTATGERSRATKTWEQAFSNQP